MAASPATVAEARVQPGRTGRTSSAPATVTRGAALLPGAVAACPFSAARTALSGSTTIRFPGSRASALSCPGRSR